MRAERWQPSGATWGDHILLQGIVVLWGVTAILGKLITLEPMPLVAWRTGLSTLALSALLLWQKDRTPLPARLVWAALGNGLLIGLHWYLFFLAGRLGNVSTSLAGIATATLWVALLEPLLIRGRRLEWSECILSLVVVGGVIMVAGNPDVNLPSLLTSVTAAGVAALFTVINSRLIRVMPPLPATTLELAAATVFAAVMASLLLPVNEATSIPTGWNWLWIGTLAIVCTAFAFTACVSLQRRVPAFTIGLAGNLEPVYGMLLALLIFGGSEAMSLRFYAGSAIIIGCVVMHALMPWLKRRWIKF